jgi:hypothetical protein
MRVKGAIALLATAALAVTMGWGAVSAQSESATADNGKPASDAPANTTTAPSVPVGANLTPPVGILPPAIISARGAGRPGSSSISVAPGTRTTGVAHEGEHAVHVADTGTSSQPDAAPAAPSSCGDFPTWYDAQLALESSIDPALINALDPNGNGIACEDLMYP